MPFRHVVMFKWNEGLDPAHVDAVRDRLSELPMHIAQIRSYTHGPDLGVSEGNFDFAVVADFDNVNDWRIYRDHPLHVLFVEEMIKGNVANRAAVQFNIGPSGRRGSSAGIEELLAEFDELG